MIRKFFFLAFFVIFAFSTPPLPVKQNSDTVNFKKKAKIVYECGIPPSKVKNPLFPEYDINNVDKFYYDLKCPTLNDLKKSNPELLMPLLKIYKWEDIQNLKHSVTVKNINFNNGTLICEYNFENYNFKIVKKIDCKYFVKDFKKLFPDKKIYSFSHLDLPNISLKKIGNFNFFNDIYLKATYDKLFKKTIVFIDKLLKEYEKDKKTYTDIDLKQLDSHTNYEKTFPAILVNLLTFNTDALGNGKNLVDNLGRLNVNFPTITNPDMVLQFMKKGTYIGNVWGFYKKNMFKDTKEALEYVENKDKYFSKSFWGFYFLFFKNIELGFRHIIELIFILGFIGLFGFALLNKKTNLIGTEIQHKFQFDFGKKFLGLATAFLFFSTPVLVSNNVKFDKKLIYDDSQVSVELAGAYTPIQGIIQTSISLGNYFGNIIADYGTFAYLSYLKNTTDSGININDLVINLNQKFAEFYWQIYNIKRKYDFVKTICVMSYPTIYNKYKRFDENINPATIESFDVTKSYYPQAMLYKTFGITQVDYKTCVNLEKQMDYDTLMLIKDLNNYITYFEKKIDANSGRIETLRKNQEEIQKMFMKYIKLHNNFGWITTISLPAMEMILKYKKIYNDLNIDELQKELGKQSAKYYSIKSEKVVKNGNDNVTQSDDTSQLDSIDKRNAIIATISKYSFYYVLPGFNDLNKNVSTAIQHILRFGLISIKKLLPPIPFLTKAVNWLLTSKEVRVFVAFIIGFIVSVMLYNLLIMILGFIIVSFALLIKIAFYFLEIFLTYLISFALSLWAITNNSQKAWEAWNNFIFQVAKLTFMPILIVFTIFSIIIINKIIMMLYGVLSFLIGEIAFSANSIEFENVNIYVNNVESFFDYFGVYMAINSFLSSSEIILHIIVILIDLLLIFKFTDWAFEIFGKRDNMGISGEIRQFTDKIKQSYGGGLV